MTMTRSLAWSAALDAANRQMRKQGRRQWNDDDWNLACVEFERLWPADKDVKTLEQLTFLQIAIDNRG